MIPYAKATKLVNKLNIFKLKPFGLQTPSSRKLKDNPHNGRRHLKVTCLIRD